MALALCRGKNVATWKCSFRHFRKALRLSTSLRKSAHGRWNARFINNCWRAPKIIPPIFGPETGEAASTSARHMTSGIKCRRRCRAAHPHERAPATLNRGLCLPTGSCLSLTRSHRAPGLLKLERALPKIVQRLAAPVAPLAESYAGRELIAQHQVVERARRDAELGADLGFFEAANRSGVFGCVHHRESKVVDPE